MIALTYESPFQEIENKLDQIRRENNRLLELCMYALIRDTKIYNHELDSVNKLEIKTIDYGVTTNWEELQVTKFDFKKDILQIINKVLGDDEKRNM